MTIGKYFRVTALLCAYFLAGCGGGSNNDDDDGTNGNSGDVTESGLVTFASPFVQIGYPSDWRVENYSDNAAFASARFFSPEANESEDIFCTLRSSNLLPDSSLAEVTLDSLETDFNTEPPPLTTYPTVNGTPMARVRGKGNEPIPQEVDIYNQLAYVDSFLHTLTCVDEAGASEATAIRMLDSMLIL